MSTARLIVPVLVAVTAAAPLCAQQSAPAPVQASSSARLSKPDIEALAKVEVAIGTARDTTQARLAMTRNKKDETQQALRDSLNTSIASILQKAGMTPADYRHRTYIVSTDAESRKVFDETVSKLTGAPIPGQIEKAAAVAQLKVPGGAVGIHIGHVVNSFSDTPNNQALLTVAVAEARTAAQHAALAMRQPGNLEYMKTHAGHVLNALDPTRVPTGPGMGYGVKRAATGVMTHIDLAAKAGGASQNVITHAAHISISAKNTVARSDEAISLAEQIRAATSAADAAKLVEQLVSVTSQLITGADKNNDGRITPTEGEGGLQACEDHVKLLLAGEGLPPA
jgi:hypothetical protein